MFGVSARGGGDVRPARLRQRRVREAARAHRLRRRRRGGDLAPPRRPLPRPRPVLVRADLRAAPAARARRPLAGHRQPGPPRAARAAGRARDLPQGRGLLGQRRPDRERVRPGRVRGEQRAVDRPGAGDLPGGAALHRDVRDAPDLAERLGRHRLRGRLAPDRGAHQVRGRRRPAARRGHAAAARAHRHARPPDPRRGRPARPRGRGEAARARAHLGRARPRLGAQGGRGDLRRPGRGGERGRPFEV